MKTRFIVLVAAALLLIGCGLAVSLTYTPPMTVGVTFDGRALYPPPPPAATHPATTTTETKQ